jgi:hypothetical protein
MVSGGSDLVLGALPADASEGWVILLKNRAIEPTPTATPQPGTSPFPPKRQVYLPIVENHCPEDDLRNKMGLER